MKEHPILFTGPMVRAILEGRKTQTRRVIKPQPEIRDGFVYGMNCAGNVEFLQKEPWHFASPGYHPTEQLWVRETWTDVRNKGFDCDLFPIGVGYKADCDADSLRIAAEYGCKWKPSIFMPRWSSRIRLEITDVRVQRLQDITEDDSNAEGFPSHYDVTTFTPARSDFAALWDSLNAKRGYGWHKNPWVWAITFRWIK